MNVIQSINQIGIYIMSSIVNTKLANDIKNNLLSIQSVFIQGMKHQDNNGNTYNSVTVQVQTIDSTGESSINTLAKMFSQYGYGDEYSRRAKTLLQNEFGFKCDYTNTYDIESKVKKSEFHKKKRLSKQHQRRLLYFNRLLINISFIGISFILA